MEKRNERKRYLLTALESTEKKDWNVTSQISCYEGFLVKNRWEKKFSRWYERHCRIIEKIKIKIGGRNDYKQKESNRISPIR